LLLTGHLAARRRVGQALLVLVWAHLALVSVRHVPVFAIVAGPLVACELSWLWESGVARRRPQSVGRILWKLGEDLRPGFARQSGWSAVLAGAAILLTPAAKWPGDFPESRFPVSLIHSELSHLQGRRVFTSDQWGDYLIYAGWPRQRVFIDGRSDFYEASLGGEYVRLVEGRPGWQSLFQKYDFDAALLPREWPLAELLSGDPAWRRTRADRLAVLYQRAGQESGARPKQIARLGR
jgi:hypothetical protein